MGALAAKEENRLLTGFKWRSDAAGVRARTLLIQQLMLDTAPPTAVGMRFAAIVRLVIMSSIGVSDRVSSIRSSGRCVAGMVLTGAGDVPGRDGYVYRPADMGALAAKEENRLLTGFIEDVRQRAEALAVLFQRQAGWVLRRQQRRPVLPISSYLLRARGEVRFVRTYAPDEQLYLENPPMVAVYPCAPMAFWHQYQVLVKGGDAKVYALSDGQWQGGCGDAAVLLLLIAESIQRQCGRVLRDRFRHLHRQAAAAIVAFSRMQQVRNAWSPSCTRSGTSGAAKTAASRLPASRRPRHPAGATAPRRCPPATGIAASLCPAPAAHSAPPAP